MKNTTYLFAAYMVIWGLIGFYVVRLGGKINDLTRRVKNLES